MKRKTKSLLFSALVFPGAGQWMLRRYKSSLIFMGVAIAATGFIGVKVFTIAWRIKDQIVQGQIAPDVLALNQMVKTELYQSNPNALSLAIWAIVLVWLLSIVDIFRLKHIK